MVSVPAEKEFAKEINLVEGLYHGTALLVHKARLSDQLAPA